MKTFSSTSKCVCISVAEMSASTDFSELHTSVDSENMKEPRWRDCGLLSMQRAGTRSMGPGKTVRNSRARDSKTRYPQNGSYTTCVFSHPFRTQRYTSNTGTDRQTDGTHWRLSIQAHLSAFSSSDNRPKQSARRKLFKDSRLNTDN